MKHKFERFSELVEVVAGLLLGACTILVVASAMGRYLFNSPIPDAFDFSRLLVGACIMWGFASVGYRGSHIKVDIFLELMGPRMRRIMNSFSWLMLLIFVILLTWKMLDRVISAYHSNESTFDLRLVVWPVMLLIWLGTAVSIVTVFARLWLIITGQGSLESIDDVEQGDM